MIVTFATSDPIRARRFMQSVSEPPPEAVIDYLVEHVEAGLIRVGDPMMYAGQAPIHPEPVMTPEQGREIQRRVAELTSDRSTDD